ncbi:MAG: hypothetical protein IKO33_00050 [Bacteroidaceae bacterium]|nr:hypothetical protein [Bacteroidaceae bacterium]
MLFGVICFIGIIWFIIAAIQKQDKANYGNYTMEKNQKRAYEGSLIPSGGASSDYMAREEGYSRGFQDGKKAYDEFVRLVFASDIKLDEGLKREYKYKYFCRNCPYDNEDYEEVGGIYYPREYSYEYMQGYEEGYNDAYDFNLKRNI